MNIGDKIAKARKDKGLTQADLGDKMHVTFQAVSKWERGESVPDFETICELSDVLGVPITYFGGKTTDEVKDETATTAAQDNYKPVLAVCEVCNKPIFDGSKIVREQRGDSMRIKCAECARKEKQDSKDKAIANGKRRRIHAFIWPSLITIIGIIASVCSLKGNALIEGIIGSAFLFPFVACLILYNNVVGEVVMGVLEWSVVKFPGIIFSFDIDGFLFLIGMKILFFVLSVLITVVCALLSVVIGGIVAIFVYPFALAKNIKYPEKGEYSNFD